LIIYGSNKYGSNNYIIYSKEGNRMFKERSISNKRRAGVFRKLVTFLFPMVFISLMALMMLVPTNSITSQISKSNNGQESKIADDQGPVYDEDDVPPESGHDGNLNDEKTNGMIAGELPHSPVWDCGDPIEVLDFISENYDEESESWLFEGPTAHEDQRMAQEVAEAIDHNLENATYAHQKQMYEVLTDVFNAMGILSIDGTPGGDMWYPGIDEEIDAMEHYRPESTRGNSYFVDSGGNLDVYTDADISFIIPMGIDPEEVESAVLTLSIYDVDETDAQSCAGGPEVDMVYINGNRLGALTGANDQWSTSTFNVDTAYVQKNNTILIDTDSTGTGCWWVKCDWGELIINGGEEEEEMRIDSMETDKKAYQLGQNIQLTVIVSSDIDADGVRLEMNLHNPAGVNVDGASANFNLPKGGSHTVQQSLYIPSDDEVGIYTIVAILHHKGIQDQEKKEVSVGSDIIVEDEGIEFVSINKDADGKVKDVDVSVMINFESDDTETEATFICKAYEINLTTGASIDIDSKTITMKPGNFKWDLNWVPKDLNVKISFVADPEDKVKEVDETNNKGERDLETKPVVKRVDMKYKGFFVHSIEVKNDFTAIVESPNEEVIGVKFYLKDKLKHTDVTKADGWKWTEYNVGELEEDTVCKVIAIAKSGEQSEPYTFEIKVWKLPWWLEKLVLNAKPITIPGLGDKIEAKFESKSLKYSVSWTILEAEDVGFSVPKAIPYIGGDYKFSTKITVGADLYLSGQIDVTGEGELKMTIMGFAGEGKLKVEGSFSAGMPPTFHGMKVTGSAKITIPLNKLLGLPSELALPDVEIGWWTIPLSKLGGIKLEVSGSPKAEIIFTLDSGFSLTETELKPGLELEAKGTISAEWYLIGKVLAELTLSGSVTGSLKIPSWEVGIELEEKLQLKVQVRSYEETFNPFGGPWKQNLRRSDDSSLTIDDGKHGSNPNWTPYRVEDYLIENRWTRGGLGGDHLTKDLLLDTSPDVVADDNGAVAVWVHDNGTGPLPGSLNIFSSSWNSYYGWSQPTPIAMDNNVDSSPSISSLPGSGQICIWTHETLEAVEGDPFASFNSTEVFYSTYNGGWSVPSNITNNSQIEGHPDVASGNSMTIAVWEADQDNDPGTTHDAELFYSIYQTGSWSMPQMVVEGGNVGMDWMPKVAFLPDGNAMVVWMNDADGNYTPQNQFTLVASIYNTTTGNWSAVSDIHTGVVNPSYDFAVNPSGELMLVFTEEEYIQAEDANHTILFTVIRSAEGNWSEASPFTTELGIVSPNVEVTDQGYYLLSASVLADNWNVVSWVQLDENYTWTPSLNISDDEYPDDQLVTSIDPTNGRVMNLWLKSNRSQGSTFDVFARDMQILPELTIEGDLTLSDPNAHAGDNITLSIPVNNTGLAKAENLEVRFYKGDPDQWGSEEIGTSTIGSIIPGELKTVSTHWIVPDVGAPLDIYAKVDWAGAITEINESNNKAFIRTLELVLDEDYISLVPYRGKYKVNMTVHNRGLCSISALYIDIFRGIAIPANLLNSTREDVVLLPGESIQLEMYFDAGSLNATERVRIVASARDYYSNVYPERSDENNRLDVYPTVVPDLSINTSSIEIPDRSQGEVEVRALVHNLGFGNAENVTVSFYLDEVNETHRIGEDFIIQRIYSGGQYTVSTMWNATPGNHQIYVIVNRDYSIIESDSGNNHASRAVTILPAPDLLIDEASISFNGTGIIVTVHNNGPIDILTSDLAVFNWDPREYMYVNPYQTKNPYQITTRGIPVIEAGGSVTLFIRIDWENENFTNGDLYVHLDPWNRIRELDETNNVGYKNLTLPSLLSPRFNPESGLPGSWFQFSVGYVSLINATPENVKAHLSSPSGDHELILSYHGGNISNASFSTEAVFTGGMNLNNVGTYELSFSAFDGNNTVHVNTSSLGEKMFIIVDNDSDNDTYLDFKDAFPDDPNYHLDSDGDGLPDAWEVSHNLSAYDSSDAIEDADSDGLNNTYEFQLGTNPEVDDTDGDGYNDGKEVDKGTDPVDPLSKPKEASSNNLLLIIIIIVVVLAIIAIAVILVIKKGKNTSDDDDDKEVEEEDKLDSEVEEGKQPEDETPKKDEDKGGTDKSKEGKDEPLETVTIKESDTQIPKTEKDDLQDVKPDSHKAKDEDPKDVKEKEKLPEHVVGEDDGWDDDQDEDDWGAEPDEEGGWDDDGDDSIMGDEPLSESEGSDDDMQKKPDDDPAGEEVNFCSECGSKASGKFCNMCGTKLV